MKIASPEKIALIKEWATQMQAANERIEPVATALKLPPESPVNEAFHGLQEAYTAAVAKLVGDTEDWLGWFSEENDFGRKAMVAGIEGNKRAIKTVEDLVWVMEVRES